MKKIILLCCLLLNGAILFGQSKKKTSKKDKATTEVGLNATFLARNFFGAEDDVTSIDDYLLYYKVIKGKNALRMGLGGFINQRVESIPGEQREVVGTNLNARIGFERRNKMGQNWIYYYGIDLVTHYDELKFRTVTGIDDITTTDKYIEGGAGPILGIQYMINDHIGISTEAALLYFFTSFSSEDASVNFPGVNINRQFEEFRIAAIAPTNIYFSVKF